MSKNIILFSTYFNTPIREDYLFNSNSIESQVPRKVMAGYFWNLLKKDGSERIWSQVYSYLKEDARKELDIEVKHLYIEQKNASSSHLDCCIKKAQDTISKDFPLTDFSDSNWLSDLIMGMDENEDERKESSLYEELINSYYEYYELEQKWSANSFRLEVLKSKDISWLTENISNVEQQESYQIYFPKGINSEYETCKGKPWFYNRLSFYKLKGSDDELSIYAIWPISTPSNIEKDGTYSWIETLTNEILSNDINNQCENLYLVLHNKDIEQIPFKIFDTELLKRGDIRRTVILFQHKEDNVIGHMLQQTNIKPKEMLTIIETRIWKEILSKMSTKLSAKKNREGLFLKLFWFK